MPYWTTTVASCYPTKRFNDEQQARDYAQQCSAHWGVEYRVYHVASGRPRLLASYQP